ncbi:carbohydrate ABC transporter permease [Fundicoccus sp. Sow4_H7]|uniref:carbohydrate ABC transporter permease n=1 Tax=Fundicoccus sp. Sow4_H7 TaxID=3438784 RepID=UPI003F9319EA
MKRRFKDNKIFNLLNIVFMIFFVAIIAIPLWNIVALSFNDATDAVRGGIYFWPREFSLESYYTVFEDPAIYRAFVISIAKTLIGVIVHTAVTAIVAYGMSKRDLTGRRLYINMGIIAMYVNGGMIPNFLLFKEIGLLNNFWVYILPVAFSFYDMVIMMNFFRSIPDSLEESAMMDGANPLVIFYKIILPLSLPVLATIALFHGVYQWNDYMVANIYVDNRELYPLQMLLFRIVSENLSPNVALGTNVVRNTTSQSLQLATMVVTTVPVVIIYPFLQKYFVQGLTLGSIKE